MGRLLSSDALTNEHIGQIKNILKIEKEGNIRMDMLFLKEGRNSITPLQIWKQTNVSEIEEQINEIVFFAGQENKVKAQLGEI